MAAHPPATSPGASQDAPAPARGKLPTALTGAALITGATVAAAALIWSSSDPAPAVKSPTAPGSSSPAITIAPSGLPTLGTAPPSEVPAPSTSPTPDVPTPDLPTSDVPAHRVAAPGTQPETAPTTKTPRRAPDTEHD